MAPTPFSTVCFRYRPARLTGREENHIDLVERYSKEQGLWRTKKSEPEFTEVLELDLNTVVPSVAGPVCSTSPNVNSTLVCAGFNSNRCGWA